jgi:hypothetical protein
VTGILGRKPRTFRGKPHPVLWPGVARRSQWCLAVDVLLNDRQRCAWAGDGEVGRRLQVCAHAGADSGAGVFASHGVGGATFEALDQE